MTLTKQNRNQFVEACANGDLITLRRCLDAGEDINQIDRHHYSSDTGNYLGEPLHISFKRALEEIPTRNLTGLGAAMTGRQPAVIDELMAHGANPAQGATHTMRGQPPLSAVEIGIDHFYPEGVEKLTREWNVPLWTNTARPVDDLLFRAIPHVRYIHFLNPRSNPDDIARARAADEAQLTRAIATFDYLVDHHRLDIRATDIKGNTLIQAAGQEDIGDFYGNDGRFVRHLLARGCDPRQECGPAAAGAPSFTVVMRKDLAQDLTGQSFDKDPTLEELIEPGLNPGRTDRSEAFRTNPVVSACYEGRAELLSILLTDPRTAIMQPDSRGHNALAALSAAREDWKAAVRGEACQEIAKILDNHMKAQSGNVTLFSPRKSTGPKP